MSQTSPAPDLCRTGRGAAWRPGVYVSRNLALPVRANANARRRPIAWTFSWGLILLGSPWGATTGCSTSVSRALANGVDAAADTPLPTDATSVSDTMTDAREVCPSLVGEPLRAPPAGPDAVVQYVESAGPTCILRGDGHIRCIGPTPLGIFGDVHSHYGTEQSPVTIPVIDDAIDFTAVNSQGCAVRRDGSVWCWGDNADGLIHPDLPRVNIAPTPVPGITHARRVLMNAVSIRTCALVADRAVCFGGDLSVPSPITALDGIDSITTNSGQTCALRSDGTVWCDNVCELRGPGFVRCTPVSALSVWRDVDPIAEISAGLLITCARTTQGEVSCRPRGGLVIQDPRGGERTFFEWTSRCVISMAASAQRVCVARTDGHVVCGGQNTDWNDDHNLLVERTVPGIDRAVKVLQTLYRSCALRDDGTFWCWGGVDPSRTPWQPVQVRW